MDTDSPAGPVASKALALQICSLDKVYQDIACMPKGLFPDMDKMSGWAACVGQDSLPILLARDPGSTLYGLTGALQDAPDKHWVTEGLINNMTRRIASLSGSYEWDLLWRLLSLEDLDVSGSQRLLIDQGHLITEMFKMIWEARFLLNEGQEVSSVVLSTLNWMTSHTSEGSQQALIDRLFLSSLDVTLKPTTNHDRLDLLFFLISLAQQNGLVGNVVLVLDGLDRILLDDSTIQARLNEMFDVCLTSERWSRLGTHVGLIIGYSSGRVLNAVKKLHPRLETRLRSCLVSSRRWDK